MTHPSKRKGDTAELEAARIVAVELGVDARRALGAGRAEDTGDIWWPGQTLTLQVKNYRNITLAVADGLDGSTRQQANAGTPYGAAMIRRPGGHWFFAQTVDQFMTMYRETL